jgi:hypothetical protein
MDDKIILELTINTQAAVVAVEKLKGELNDSKAKLKDMKDTGSIAFREQAVEVTTLSHKYKELTKAVNTQVKEEFKQEKSVVGLSKSLGKMKKELQEMRAAGKQTTDEYKAMAQAAGSLQDSIDKVSNEIKVLSDDQAVFKGLADTVKVGTMGMQTYHAVTALTGVENEKMVETIMKLQAAQQLANAAQGISVMLAKSGRLAVLAKLGAMKAWGVVNKIYTATQWSANAALNAFPLILIISLIILLITNVKNLINWFKQLAQWMGFTSEETEEVAVATRDYAMELAILEKAQQKLQKEMKHNIDLLKAKGASIEEVKKAERELLIEEINATKQRLILRNEELKSMGKRFGQFTEEAQEKRKAFQQEIDQLDTLRKSLEIFDVTEDKRRKDERVKRNEENAKKKADDDKRIADEFRREELAAAKLLVLKAKTDAEKIKAEVDYEKVLFEQRKAAKQLTDSELQVLETEHLTKLEEIRNQFDEAARQKAEEARLAEEERKAAEREELVAYLEEVANNGLTEVDLLQQKLKRFEDLRAANLISEEEFAAASAAIQQELTDINIALLQARTDASMAATDALVKNVGKIVGAEAAAAKVSKAIAIAQTGIDIVRTISAATAAGPPQNIPLILLALAQTAGLVSQIKDLTIPSTGFYTGGYTGDGGKYEPKGVVHGGEYVINKANVQALGGWQNIEAAMPNQNSARGKNFYTGGFVGFGETGSLGGDTEARMLDAIRTMKVQATIEDINAGLSRESNRMEIATI